MATIEKRISRKGGVSYRVKIRKRGYPNVTETFRTKSVAQRWAKQTEVDIENGRFRGAEAKKHTFAEMIERFRKYELPKIPKMEPMLVTQLSWWESQLGDYRLSEITSAKITECRDKLAVHGKTKKLSPATINRYLQALSLTYRRAVKDWHWVEENPVSNVEKLKEPRGRVRYLSDDRNLADGTFEEGERTRLLKACKESSNTYIYPVVVLALSTGMRQSEIMNLTWDDVDLVRGQIVIHHTKNGERRAVPLVNHAFEEMKNLSKVRRIDTNFCFPSHHRFNPKPINLRDPWLKAIKKRRSMIFDSMI